MIEPPLTSRGEQRREAILPLMQHAARQRRNRRRAIRSTAACAAIVLVLGIAMRWRSQGGGAVPGPEQIATMPRKSITPAPEIAPAPQFVIGRIETDPTILQRWSVGATERPARSLEPIDDDDLIRSLADAGQSAGLIHVGGETTLVTSSAAQ